MSKIEKIKRVVLISLGFGLATYLIMSGMAVLDKEEKSSLVESNVTSEVHSNTVK
jgi:hypothetical protein